MLVNVGGGGCDGDNDGDGEGCSSGAPMSGPGLEGAEGEGWVNRSSAILRHGDKTPTCSRAVIMRLIAPPRAVLPQAIPQPGVSLVLPHRLPSSAGRNRGMRRCY